MDPLFPALPEDLKTLSDAEVAQLLADHESASELILADDAEFLKDMDANEVIDQFKVGVEQIKSLRAESGERVKAFEEYKAEKERLAAEITMTDEDAGVEDDAEGEGEEAESLEVVAEEEEVTADSTEGERVLVTASTGLATTSDAPEVVPVMRFSRRAPERTPEPTPEIAPEGTALVAAGEMSLRYTEALTEDSLAMLVRDAAVHHGPHPKIDPPGKYRFGGPEHKIARADFDFPADRTLNGDVEEATEKIRAVIPNTSQFLGRPGDFGNKEPEALVASGGPCAPLTPIYSMPNFATTAEPVWDSLPVFRAARGGVNTPEATVIGDITEAISSISEADDALGGTFATKSCQDLECPPYTEVAVQILAHCRMYGNLNARAWPEKIAHENALTMAALSRTSEGFMLDRIKALSVNVTNGVETLGALIYLVDGIVKSQFGIRSRLRMPREARFRVLLPAVATDILLLDTIQTQFDRFRTRDELTGYLRSTGIDPVFYIDTPSTGTSQIADASQTAAAIDPLPDNIQWALFPEGAFIGVDSGSLELGIVRDSVLNVTNDFQIFGERFRNVARLAPAQAAYWVTTDLCASGQFPPAGTVRTCD